MREPHPVMKVVGGRAVPSAAPGSAPLRAATAAPAVARAVLVATRSEDMRQWPSVGVEPRALVTVAGRPVIFHVLDALAASGITDVVLVAEPAHRPHLELATGDGADWRMRVSHVQAERGSGWHGALQAARELTAGAPVLVQRADLLHGDGVTQAAAVFGDERLDGLALMVPTGLEDERVPGGWLLGTRAAAGLLVAPGSANPLSSLGQGARTAATDHDGCLAFHGGESALLRANRYALQRLEAGHEPDCLQDSEVQGPVAIHPTATLQRTLVRGPVFIGPGAMLRDTYVGPYTSIGADVRLEGAEIEHSIVMDGAELLHVGVRLETSIIGRGASVVRRFDVPRAVRLRVGDGAEVALS